MQPDTTAKINPGDVKRVCDSLAQMSFGNCGFIHHHTWRRDGVELPPCANSKREKLFDCAHSTDLNLRAAVDVAQRVGIITTEERGLLFRKIHDLYENVFGVDELAFELSGVNDHIRHGSTGRFPFDGLMMHREGLPYEVESIPWDKVEAKLLADQRNAAQPRETMRDIF